MNWKPILNIYLKKFGLNDVGDSERLEPALYRLIKAVRKQSSLPVKTKKVNWRGLINNLLGLEIVNSQDTFESAFHKVVEFIASINYEKGFKNGIKHSQKLLAKPDEIDLIPNIQFANSCSSCSNYTSKTELNISGPYGLCNGKLVSAFGTCETKNGSNITVADCCRTCEFYTLKSKTCTKHDISTCPIAICDEYVLYPGRAEYVYQTFVLNAGVSEAKKCLRKYGELEYYI